LFERHRNYFGKNSSDTLVIQAPSRLLNPTLDAGVIASAQEADAFAAQSEWLGEFRNDIGAFLDDALIDAAIDYGRPLELPPRLDKFSYKFFVDCSAGRSDHYTLASGHREEGRLVIDFCRGYAPRFDPSFVTHELANLAKSYGCHEVTGDNFSAEWAQGAWRSHDISYAISELNKSALYLEALTCFTQGLVAMPDHPRLIRELRLLERRTHRSGRDTVDHGLRGGHDDYANAICGLLYQLARRENTITTQVFPGYPAQSITRLRTSSERAGKATFTQDGDS
jgi:hypothetical protein